MSVVPSLSDGSVTSKGVASQLSWPIRRGILVLSVKTFSFSTYSQTHTRFLFERSFSSRSGVKAFLLLGDIALMVGILLVAKRNVATSPA
jgi:hypothetical protein